MFGLTTKKVIKFYSPRFSYGEFSNFARYPIVLDGRRWPTSEHYFQAQKFVGTQDELKIQQASTPSEAARLGRDRTKPLREDWESVKVEVMRRAVRAKFTQYENLHQLLLSTGDALLVEHTEKDSYWGDGGDGSGKNMLGHILMEVRDDLKLCERDEAVTEKDVAQIRAFLDRITERVKPNLSQVPQGGLQAEWEEDQWRLNLITGPGGYGLRILDLRTGHQHTVARFSLEDVLNCLPKVWVRDD